MSSRCRTLLFCAFVAANARAANLPSDACVRQVRSARIDALRGQTDAALARLREAVEACPDALVPLVALIDAGRGYGLPEEDRQALLVRLDQRLADAGRPLVSGELGVIATRPGIDEGVLRRILPPLASRVAAMLGDYRAVKQNGDMLRYFLSLPQTHPGYMPVTRDLSRDKLRMILQWIDRGMPL